MPLITIEKLRGLSRREFAIEFKKLTISKMKNILNEYGIWVKSSYKSQDIQELLLDVVEGIITPSDKDKEKIQKSKEKKRNSKIKLSEIEEKIKEFYYIFKELCSFDEKAIKIASEIGYINVFKEEEMNTIDIKRISRQFYIEIHPDKAKGYMWRYSKKFGCYKAMFDGLLNRCRENEENQKREQELERMRETRENMYPHADKDVFF